MVIVHVDNHSWRSCRRRSRSRCSSNADRARAYTSRKSRTSGPSVLKPLYTEIPLLYKANGACCVLCALRLIT